MSSPSRCSARSRISAASILSARCLGLARVGARRLRLVAEILCIIEGDLLTPLGVPLDGALALAGGRGGFGVSRSARALYFTHTDVDRFWPSPSAHAREGREAEFLTGTLDTKP